LISDRSIDSGREGNIDKQAFDFLEAKYPQGMYNYFPAIHFFSKKEL
jgi:hypothetical protein